MITTRRIAGLLRAVFFAGAIAVAGCAGGMVSTPPYTANFQSGTTRVALTTIDYASGGPCAISTDGYIWYDVSSGTQPPIDFTLAKCAHPATLDSHVAPAIPAWARRPAESTQTIFVATSLEERYSAAGLQAMSHDAAAADVPQTFMVGNSEYISDNAPFYNHVHASYGDDVELENDTPLYDLASADLPFYSPAVSVEGAGRERNIAGLLARGDGGFWGITWNSHGTDNTSDEGAPWGTYCADVTSYKRPSPTGDCSLLAFEWTARDLTRAYLANTNSNGYSAEAAFSTDPEDILDRAGFGEDDGQAYERALVDAYAAAGVTQPIVMMSQQESAEESADAAADDPLITALYQEASATGMKTMTLRDALPVAKTFSARPRAIAFPFIAGGKTTAYNGVQFTPATIDFHDDLAGMTFISGHTLPSRLFTYALDPQSVFNQTLAQTPVSDFPTLQSASVANGALSLTFNSPRALHFGIALWTDATSLGLSGSNVTPAGRGGVVVTFDLPAGSSVQRVPCANCASTTFQYSQ